MAMLIHALIVPPHQLIIAGRFLLIVALREGIAAILLVV
jgi:hypothetical protein